jgi:SAM-dependent methyltransferase
MELAGAHWGERAREQQLAVLPSSWAESPVVIREYINPRVSGTGDQGWLEAVARDYFKQPVKVALSLGCGGGGLERHGLQLNIATRFEAYDVSAGAIELAREEAGITGQQDAIDYQVANLNKIELPARRYGAVFASQSVHHIEALEHYMAQVHRALKPGGLFIINEFVGPNQFQWTDTQLEHANRLLKSIPEKYRHCIREAGEKHHIPRPTIDAMNAYDPTEAIRARDILPQLVEHFELVEQRDFGGTLLHLVLDNIAGNLDQSEEGIAILRRLMDEEDALIKSGELDSDFTLLIARKR